MSERSPEKVPGRFRMALLLASPVVLVSVAILSMSIIALARMAGLDGSNADAGLARIGGDLALVIVTRPGPDLAAARALIVGWGVVLPAVALVAGSLTAWWLAGRVGARVERARSEVIAADSERQGRLQEVVHELRTPLAILGTNLELATGVVEPEGNRYIDAARRAVGRMSRTVDDLAGHGQLAVEAEAGPVALADIVASVVEEHAGPGRERGVAMRPDGAEHVIVHGVDGGALRTALGNFVTNAIRLAPRGSRVTVSWGEEPAWAWISVSDDGPGLPPHHHARAFERGWQGPHDLHRHTGSGLGLTIARQLTEAQGGAVTLESEEGGGATFTIWLPLDLGSHRDQVVAADGVHPLARPWATSSASV